MNRAQFRNRRFDVDQKPVDLVEVDGRFVVAEIVEASNTRAFVIELFLAALMPWRVLSMNDQLWNFWGKPQTRSFLRLHLAWAFVLVAMPVHAYVRWLDEALISLPGTLLYGVALIALIRIVSHFSIRAMALYAALSILCDLTHLGARLILPHWIDSSSCFSNLELAMVVALGFFLGLRYLRPSLGAGRS